MKNTSSDNLHCKETPRPNYLHNSCSGQEIKQINIVLFCEKCEGIFKSVHKENEALVYRSYNHRGKMWKSRRLETRNNSQCDSRPLRAKLVIDSTPVHVMTTCFLFNIAAVISPILGINVFILLGNQSMVAVGVFASLLEVNTAIVFFVINPSHLFLLWNLNDFSSILSCQNWPIFSMAFQPTAPGNSMWVALMGQPWGIKWILWYLKIIPYFPLILLSHFKIFK